MNYLFAQTNEIGVREDENVENDDCKMCVRVCARSENA